MKDDERASEQPKASGEPWPGMWPKDWLVPMVLLLVRQWSSYGYELMERLATFGFALMNPGTFYRILRQMEKDGMVSSAWDTSSGGPARRVYSITDAGEAYLRVWAESLGQYQRMMETLFRLYMGHPADGKAHNKDENKP
jgi:poly-beta-hydroxybutyrate-responsive repressor